jgi:hypothetical protein
VDEPPDEDADAEAEAARLRQLNGPSQEAKDKFEDYRQHFSFTSVYMTLILHSDPIYI